MDQNRRRNNPQDMSIVEQIEKIKEEMCDRYCKYIMLNGNGDLSNDGLMEKCNCCPLTRL